MKEEDDMKVNFSAFRNGKNSLKITWVSAKGRKRPAAQGFRSGKYLSRFFKKGIYDSFLKAP